MFSLSNVVKKQRKENASVHPSHAFKGEMMEGFNSVTVLTNRGHEWEARVYVRRRSGSLAFALRALGSWGYVRRAAVLAPFLYPFPERAEFRASPSPARIWFHILRTHPEQQPIQVDTEAVSDSGEDANANAVG